MPKEAKKWIREGRTVCVRLSRQQYEALNRAASQRQSTVSDQLRRAVNNEFFIVPADITESNHLRDSA